MSRWRIALTLLGAALLVASAFLGWLGTGAARSPWGLTCRSNPVVAGPETASGVPGVDGIRRDPPRLIAVAGLVPRTGVVTSVTGALGIVAFVCCVVTLYRVPPGYLGIGEVGIGAWLLLVGGILDLVGGIVGARSARREARG